MLTNKLTGAGAADKTYIEDVFSTYLYTGNGSTQTINNGIDLAGKGGMVWAKSRNDTFSNLLFDTSRGATNFLVSNTTDAQSTSSATLTSFNSNGFSLDASAAINGSGTNYASWTFRKAPKFFDVVTYTGNGADGRRINHSLGVAPGMIIIKATSTTGRWFTWQRTFADYSGNGDNLFLDGADALSKNGVFGIASTQTSSVFTLGTGVGAQYNSNVSGVTYVAYLFAHDTTADGLIQCGSFTGAATVNLGWEPQYVLYKRSNTTSNWNVSDNMRGTTASGGTQTLFPNLSNSESSSSSGIISFNATGFTPSAAGASETYIYMAIRRGPMKTPTDGTKVFNNVLRQGTGAADVVNTNITSDLVIHRNRSITSGYHLFLDRLRGSYHTFSQLTNAEIYQSTYFPSTMWDVQTGYRLLGTNSAVNSTSYNYVDHVFRRAPGFFDVVCYTGDGSLPIRVIPHNLKAVPELLICKPRSGVGSWRVTTSNDKFLDLNSSSPDPVYTGGILYRNNSVQPPDINSFLVSAADGSVAAVNASGVNYVAYLFASCPGVSKVGSYTGNGGTQTINCGFTAGARFFLVKATSTTGNWWVYDSARGIVSSTDPVLALNSTAAEITSADAVDPDSTGIIVNQEATCSINANGVSYIYLAIA